FLVNAIARFSFGEDEFTNYQGSFGAVEGDFPAIIEAVVVGQNPGGGETIVLITGAEDIRTFSTQNIGSSLHYGGERSSLPHIPLYEVHQMHVLSGNHPARVIPVPVPL